MTLIPGFKEGLSQMKEGGKAVFVIPADKGYGENGAGPVPPESALIFEVTLKKLKNRVLTKNLTRQCRQDILR